MQNANEELSRLFVTDWSDEAVSSAEILRLIYQVINHELIV